MKKLITLLLLFLSVNVFCQTTDSVKVKPTYYVSIGLSIGNVNPVDENSNNFNKASYPSIEIGLMYKNITLGTVVGTENIFATSSTRGFYELKTTISNFTGKFSEYALLGVGAYMENSFNNFIEYGAGFSYTPKKIGYFAQYSNWARTNYISIGITLNF